MSLRARNRFVYILVIVAVAAVVFGLRYNEQLREDITLWELVDDINAGDVKTLTLSNAGELKATYFDNTTRTADYDADEEQVYMILEWYEVDPEMLYSIEVKSPERNSFANWLGIFGTLLPLLLIGGFFYMVIHPTKTTGAAIKKSPARQYQPAIKFGDLGGMDDAVGELRGLIDLLKTPERLAQHGAHLPHGILLTGEPGTGKTRLAQAVGSEAGVTFFEVGGSQFIELFTGVAVSRIRDLFAQAEKHVPAVIFIDELDATGSYRSTSDTDQTDERQQALSQLCVELDRLASPVLVIGATNRPDLLDPALLRSGRLERVIHLPRPDAAGRERILQLHARIRPLDGSVDLTAIAHSTEGWVGADLARLVNEAAALAIQEGRSALTQADFERAIQNIEPSIRR